MKMQRSCIFTVLTIFINQQNSVNANLFQNIINNAQQMNSLQVCDEDSMTSSQLQFNSCPGGYGCINCKATLISQEWAITAASCVDWYQPGMSLEDSRLTDNNGKKYLLSSVSATSEPIIIHPDYASGLYYDIALIKLPANDLPISCISKSCQSDSQANTETFANFYDCNRDQFYGVLDGTSICANNDVLAANIGYDEIYPGTPVFDDAGSLRGIFGWAGENQFRRGQPFVSLTRVSSYMKWVAQMLEAQGDSLGADMEFWLNGTRSKCIEGSGPTDSGAYDRESGRNAQGAMQEIITDKAGYISTPNYGKADYPNNYKHTWKFRSADFIADAGCIFYGDDQPWASIDFHFSDQMYLEGSNKVCYDKLLFKYKDSNNDEAEVETMELCGNREPFDLTIPTTEVNVTFVSDYSMAKRGFYAKFNVVYNEKCYKSYDHYYNENEKVPENDENESDGLGFPNQVGLGQQDQGLIDMNPFDDYNDDLDETGIDQGRGPSLGENDRRDGRAFRHDELKDVSVIVYVMLGVAMFAILSFCAVVILLHVQTELKRVTIITQGADGAGDAIADSEKGMGEGGRSAKHAPSVDGFTREDVEMITESILAAIQNKSMSSIRSSPNKTAQLNQSNHSHQIITQYHSPRGDKFKKLSRKNAVENIHDHENNNTHDNSDMMRSPLVRKSEVHDIHEKRMDRSLNRKYANHDIHGQDNSIVSEFDSPQHHQHRLRENTSRECLGYDMFLTKNNNDMSRKVLTPRHSSPNLPSPRSSKVSIPQQLLRQKVQKKHKMRDTVNYPNPSESTQSLKKYEQIDEIDDYVVKLKRSEAKMSIHNLHDENTLKYPKYPSHTLVSHVETRSIPRMNSFSEDNSIGVHHPRRAEEKISVNSRHMANASKNTLRMNSNDPFTVARPADAKTSVSIANLSKSDNESENSYEEKTNNMSNSPVKMSSIYSKNPEAIIPDGRSQKSNNNSNTNLSTEQDSLPNSVDQIIDNL